MSDVRIGPPLLLRDAGSGRGGPISDKGRGGMSGMISMPVWRLAALGGLLFLFGFAVAVVWLWRIE